MHKSQKHFAGVLSQMTLSAESDLQVSISRGLWGLLSLLFPPVHMDEKMTLNANEIQSSSKELSVLPS